MKVDEGEWKGWKVWLEYLGDDRTPLLREYKIKYMPPPATSGRFTPRESRVDVLIACEHGKDFQICVQPPRFNMSEYNVTPFVDGRRIRGCITASKGGRVTRPTCISYAYEASGERVVKKTLRFAQLEHTGDPSYRPGVGMGAIEVVLSKGKATMGGMSLPRVSIAPQSAIHGTGEDVGLTSYVGGDIIEEAEPSRVYHLKVDTSVPKCRVRFLYATQEAVKAQLSVAEYNVRLCPDPGPLTPLVDRKKKSKTNSGVALNVGPVSAMASDSGIGEEHFVKKEPSLQGELGLNNILNSKKQFSIKKEPSATNEMFIKKEPDVKEELSIKKEP